MAQWPPEAVATVELFIRLVLILPDELEAGDQRLAKLEEEVKELKRTLNTNSGLSESPRHRILTESGGKKTNKDTPDKPGMESQDETASPESDAKSNGRQGGPEDTRQPPATPQNPGRKG